jgi:hypothetical protein
MVTRLNKNEAGKLSPEPRTQEQGVAYFKREAAKLLKSVSSSKETAQTLIIEAMEHAETHGDWTGSLLPIMEVMLNGPNKAAGVFGTEMGRAFAVYITTYTKLVYNPKGLNGRKLNKLPIAERWAWDKSKSFDVEAARNAKWWTLKPATNGDVDKDFDEDAWTAKANRFVVSIQSLIDDGKIAEQAWPAYRDELIAKLNKVKFPAVVAGRELGTDADIQNDGRTGTVNPTRVVDGQADEREHKAA